MEEARNRVRTTARPPASASLSVLFEHLTSRLLNVIDTELNSRNVLIENRWCRTLYFLIAERVMTICLKLYYRTPNFVDYLVFEYCRRQYQNIIDSRILHYRRLENRTWPILPRNILYLFCKKLYCAHIIENCTVLILSKTVLCLLCRKPHCTIFLIIIIIGMGGRWQLL